MSLFITSLNSGSNGNCYYIGNEHEAILVDAGLSCRETEKRMARLQLPMERIKAIFISHEHSDHIFGLPVLSKKYRLPVYITDRTRLNSFIKIDPQYICSFASFQPVTIGDLVVYPFPKIHDAADPHSFIISYASVKVGVFTDIGNACKNVIESFSLCNAVFLESNYDEHMLMNGRYPYHLKQRITGGKGHLSNTQAFQLYARHRPQFMSHLLLAHLSRENNCPDKVQQLFEPYHTGTRVVVASRYKETEVYEISSGSGSLRALPNRQAQVQLSLF